MYFVGNIYTDVLLIVIPIVGVCNCSMFCCTLLYVHSSIAIILMGKRELAALLNLSSWCLVMVERLFLAIPWGCLRIVIVVFPDHTHLLFLVGNKVGPTFQSDSPFTTPYKRALSVPTPHFTSLYRVPFRPGRTLSKCIASLKK